VVKIVIPERIQAAAALGDRAEEAGVLGSFSPTRKSVRPGAASRADATMSAITCRGLPSMICCVASRRSPSKWYSSIQYRAFVVTYSLTRWAFGPSKLKVGPHSE